MQQTDMEFLSKVSKLSDEQQAVIEAIRQRRNVLVTGGAGTGKSFLVQYLISDLRKRHKRFAVTASTGIAALNIEGITVHSWAGMGIAEDKTYVANKILAKASLEVDTSKSEDDAPKGNGKGEGKELEVGGK